MNRTKLAALLAGTALAALAAGCRDTGNTNTNLANANSNTAVVRSNDNSNMGGNTNANAGRTANYNANMSREDYDRNKETYSEEAKRAGSRVGTGANDGWLWTKVRASLLAADDLRESTINVDVDNAVVTLNGTVETGQQKVRAVDVAKKVEGVKSVTNNLKVSADGGSGTNSNNSNRKG